MGRKRRRWEPGAIHHVDVRAHDGDPVFALDDDRRFVVERAARVFSEEGVVCFGWAVLVNHFHLLARFPGPPGAPMHRLNTAIARRVRLRGGGQGPVFQGRFFGDPCKDGASVLRRLAYVTANPIHHGVVQSVQSLQLYPWSSLGEVVGRRTARLADPAATLSLLDAPPLRAVAVLLDLLESRVATWNAEDAARPAPRHPDIDAHLDAEPAPAAGDAAAVRCEVTRWERMAARRHRLRAAGWHPQALIEAACVLTGVSAAAVEAGDRRHAASRARSIVAHVACGHLAWPTGEVAAALGVSVSATIQARRRGARTLAEAEIAAEEVLRRCGANG